MTAGRARTEQRKLVITFREVWFLGFGLDRLEDTPYLRKATQLSIICSVKLIPTT